MFFFDSVPAVFFDSLPVVFLALSVFLEAKCVVRQFDWLIRPRNTGLALMQSFTNPSGGNMVDGLPPAIGTINMRFSRVFFGTYLKVFMHPIFNYLIRTAQHFWNISREDDEIMTDNFFK